MGQIRFQQATFGRLDPDRHRLPVIGFIALHDDVVGNVGGRQPIRESPQAYLVGDMQRDGVGAIWERRLCGITGSVNKLGGLDAEGDVGADDAIVRQIFRVNDSCVNYAHSKIKVKRVIWLIREGSNLGPPN